VVSALPSILQDRSSKSSESVEVVELMSTPLGNMVENGGVSPNLSITPSKERGVGWCSL
jgi:hypothetical protein